MTSIRSRTVVALVSAVAGMLTGILSGCTATGARNPVSARLSRIQSAAAVQCRGDQPSRRATSCRQRHRLLIHG